MAGLVPAIYVFLVESKTWMRGSGPRMTGYRLAYTFFQKTIVSQNPPPGHSA